jgi:broad specificity phosphatase PhoE
MKVLLLCCLLIVLQNETIAQPFTGKIYIVRHAEKATVPVDDPVLTTAGYKRAGDLMRKLRYECIRRSYVTQLRRTQLTADSLRIRLMIDTVHYHHDNYDGLLQSIRLHGDAGRTILIIAHSNTIPKIIRKLGVLNYPQADILEWQFDNLYLVTFPGGVAKVTKTKYGATSVQPPTP